MEQHRTRTPQRTQPAQGRPAPPGGLGEVTGAAGYPVAVAVAPAPAAGPGPGPRRTAPPVVLALRRFPNPRLTGIGAGLFAALAMFLLACVDRLLLGGSELVYGLLFLPVSALTALWVRPADLVTAPIIVPIAFAVGVIPVAGGTGGFGGQAMAVVTALAVQAGWLYGGTLVAGLIASVRKIRQMRERQRHLARADRAVRRPRA
ncbi:DUF6542 domain-containing protein [Streptomyces sp. QL37]|uniref:DUF6542 domain-containing protein n=1 Tax=Streptomyces sp. QL37 TaxID=2093747 RepID=UPI000CF1E3C0|nr:DUF6542 domain-containing protein [Streptomyces sp. QL37]PPQ59481.1 hypothetical protein C5F59_24545 [Streptomyces sp. QL37]